MKTDYPVSIEKILKELAAAQAQNLELKKAVIDCDREFFFFDHEKTANITHAPLVQQIKQELSNEN